MLGPLNVKLEEFAVSPSNAFLPDQLPLTQLPDPYYAPWEAVLSHLPTLLCSASLRNHIDQLDVLSTSRLSGEREWQRAYLILSFFTHGYIWEAGGPSEVCHPPHDPFKHRTNIIIDCSVSQPRSQSHS